MLAYKLECARWHWHFDILATIRTRINFFLPQPKIRKNWLIWKSTNRTKTAKHPYKFEYFYHFLSSFYKCSSCCVVQQAPSITNISSPPKLIGNLSFLIAYSNGCEKSIQIHDVYHATTYTVAKFGERKYAYKCHTQNKQIRELPLFEKKEQKINKNCVFE